MRQTTFTRQNKLLLLSTNIIQACSLHQFSSLTIIQVYGFKDCVGALEEPSGAFWPYRLITGTFGNLFARYGARLMIETHTPVCAISSAGNRVYPYVLTTTRGSIAAKHIVHCTNAHASHLLPALRGLIYPLRGTMSVQAPHPSFPRL